VVDESQAFNLVEILRQQPNSGQLGNVPQPPVVGNAIDSESVTRSAG